MWSFFSRKRKPFPPRYSVQREPPRRQSDAIADDNVVSIVTAAVVLDMVSPNAPVVHTPPVHHAPTTHHDTSHSSSHSHSNSHDSGSSHSSGSGDGGGSSDGGGGGGGSE